MISKNLNNIITALKQGIHKQYPYAYNTLKKQYHDILKRVEAANRQPHIIGMKEQYCDLEFFSEMSKLPSPHILEIGSRTVISSMPRHLITSRGRFTGLDIMEGEGVDVVGDAHRLSELFEPNTFDGVYSAAVFEHIAMPWKAALEINKVLRPGGFVYIGSHHTFPTHEMPWDFWRYGRDAFSTILGSFNGFEIENEAIIWPGSLCHHGTNSVISNGRRCYLFTHVLARKTGNYEPSKYKWDIDCTEVLPKWHFYPEKTERSMTSQPGEGHIKRRFRSLENPVGSVDELFDGFLKDVKQQHAPKIAIITTLNGKKALRKKNLTGLKIDMQVYTDVKNAKAIYKMPAMIDEGQFDAVILWDVMGLLEYPWVAAPSIAHIIRPGGRLFVVDRSTKPFIQQPDLWRFSSEAFRVIFNPVVGFEIEDALIANPVTLHPANFSDPIFKYYNKADSCYLTSACVATRVQTEPSGRFIWNVD
ncbi:MAG: methyltransferase domain-containing protein [Nitrospirae bacterium]|nr:methyltransferase domain-containing protein [Nitrospirota bacterium]